MGEFTVNIEQLPGRNAAQFTLTGMMWDAGFEGEGVPDNAWNTTLVFVFLGQRSDINSLGPLRTR